MNRNFIKYIIIAILYVISIIEAIVVIHTFGHYKKVEESVNISNNMIKNINNTQVEEQTEPGVIEKVRERNEFYTAALCVNKYLGYLEKKDAQAVYDCLDQSYIEQKEITENNVLNRLENLNSMCSFSARKMSKQEITKETTQYYAYGKLTGDSVSLDPTSGNDFYISIKINTKTGTFTILPDTYIN